MSLSLRAMEQPDVVATLRGDLADWRQWIARIVVLAHAALICTEWDAYKKIDWERAGNLMARKLLVDGRNLFSPARMKALGFEYTSFGRE